VRRKKEAAGVVDVSFSSIEEEFIRDSKLKVPEQKWGPSNGRSPRSLM